MKLNHFTLAFVGPLEKLEQPFLDAYFKKYLAQTKLLHLATIFIYGSICLIDVLLFPELKGPLLTIRATICTLFLVGFCISFTRIFPKIWQVMFGCYIIVSGFSFILSMVVAKQHLMGYSYAAGMIVCMIFGYIFIRARFVTAFISCWFLFICYEICATWLLKTPMTIFIATSYYLGIVTVLGTVIAHILEYNERKAFYQSHMLALTNQDLRIKIETLQRTEDELAQANRDLTNKIEALKRTEDALNDALKQKEVFLEEINHRAKNNLQVVSSLLDMTCNRSDIPIVQKTLMGARAKIQAMSLVHHQLYTNENVRLIDMGEQIRELYQNLSTVYGCEIEIRAEIKVHDVYLALDQAMPCALVINELISNVLEHAFIGRTRGNLEILMRVEDKTAYLNIKDDGVGLPMLLDLERIESLGLRLVRLLVTKQLKGKIQVVRNGGTTWIINFKIN